MAALRNGVVNFSAKLLPVSSISSILQKRGAYIGQPVVDSPVEPRQFEVSRNPEEWKYVAKLLRTQTVPPVTPKAEYPSGWKPPREEGRTHPYFVERSKNHMLSLYLYHEDRGQRKLTVIKRVQGDIWKLHEEVKEHVEEMEGKKIASQVLECNSIIKLKGDRYHWVEQFLLSKGF